MLDRCISFKSGTKTRFVYFIQFLTPAEAAVFQQPDVSSLFTLRGLVQGWDPLDNFVLNGLNEYMSRFNGQFALIRQTVIHAFRVESDETKPSHRLRASSVVQLYAPEAAHTALTNQLSAAVERDNHSLSPFFRLSSNKPKYSTIFTLDNPTYLYLTHQFLAEIMYANHVLHQPLDSGSAGLAAISIGSHLRVLPCTLRTALTFFKHKASRLYGCSPLHVYTTTPTPSTFSHQALTEKVRDACGDLLPLTAFN